MRIAGIVLQYAVAGPLLAALLIVACSRATPENYARIKPGMHREQVYEILGKPDEIAATGAGMLSVSAETWKGRHSTIRVTFNNGRVALRSINQTAAAGS